MPIVLATHNPHSPRKYLKQIWFDTCVHDDLALKYLIDLCGTEQLMLGTDYPFPLGEQEPGKLIESLGLSEKQNQDLYSRTALRWLGLD